MAHLRQFLYKIKIKEILYLATWDCYSTKFWLTYLHTLHTHKKKRDVISKTKKLIKKQ